MTAVGRPGWARTGAIAVGVALLAALPCDSALADAPSGRFIVDDNSVHDLVTGLIWERFAPPQTTSWANAGSHCAQLSIAGLVFRLPSPNELLTIIDVRRTSPAVDTAVFGDVGPTDAYWTGATLQPAGGFVWVVYAQSGELYAPVDPEDMRTYRGRCVAASLGAR